MKRLETRIKDDEGLHARPASRLVSLCLEYSSAITIKLKGSAADGKNITEVLALGAEKGDMVEIDIRGKDESAAERALNSFFDAGDDKEEDGQVG